VVAQQGRDVDALLDEMAPLPGARDLLVTIKERGQEGGAGRHPARVTRWLLASAAGHHLV
jgi:hypothetical protein